MSASLLKLSEPFEITLRDDSSVRVLSSSLPAGKAAIGITWVKLWYHRLKTLLQLPVEYG